jgi:hypothetical protein
VALAAGADREIAVSICSGVTTIDWPIDIIGCDRPDQVRPPGTCSTPVASLGSGTPSSSRSRTSSPTRRTSLREGAGRRG